MALSVDLLQTLAAEADRADRHADWPAASWAALRSAGVLSWSIPPEFGGQGLETAEVLSGSAELAGACLTTAFILSQREAAIRRLRRAPIQLRERYLPGVARDEIFVTVGLSQLTTSQRHGSATLHATANTKGFRLSGFIPWVTGADQAEAIVIGAMTTEGEQLLVMLPTDRQGVVIDPPMNLAALNGSRTSAVHCENVEIASNEVMAGPGQNLVGLGGGGLETSCLALGLAQAATDMMAKEAAQRPTLVETVSHCRSSIEALRQRLLELANSSALDPDQVLALRVESTELVLRTTQAALIAAKGTGFVYPHPAQRFARQALFFLVWSCPRSVADGVLELLTPLV